MLLEDLYSTYWNNPRRSTAPTGTLHGSLSPSTALPLPTPARHTPPPGAPRPARPPPPVINRTSTTAPSTPTRPKCSPRRTAAPATASPSRSTASWASCRRLWRRTPTRRRRCRFLSARRCISLWRLWPAVFLLSRWGVGVARLSEREGRRRVGGCGKGYGGRRGARKGRKMRSGSCVRKNAEGDGYGLGGNLVFAAYG